MGIVQVDFGRMVIAPLLPLLSYSVVDDEDAIAVHALNDRFGNGGSAADGRKAFDLLQRRAERVAQAAQDVLPADGFFHLCHRFTGAVSDYHHILDVCQ